MKFARAVIAVVEGIVFLAILVNAFMAFLSFNLVPARQLDAFEGLATVVALLLLAIYLATVRNGLKR